MERQIILASVSPRRRQLFKLFNIQFKAADSGYEEVMHKHLKHAQLVKLLALGKVKSAAKKYPRAIIVAADTIVSFRGKAIGKPKGPREAAAMLKNFSGKTHSLITGTAVLDAQTGKAFTNVTKSKISFRKLTEQEILNYVNSREPFGKAGGYNLQGAGFNLIKKISGDFTNNLGLPMGVVFNFLKKLGVKT